ncbi:MAG: choice-of-anchor tandem repeat GloVer-containing protein, partial [Acetobacteraceae bacterium]
MGSAIVWGDGAGRGSGYATHGNGQGSAVPNTTSQVEIDGTLASFIGAGHAFQPDIDNGTTTDPAGTGVFSGDRGTIVGPSDAPPLARFDIESFNVVLNGGTVHGVGAAGSIGSTSVADLGNSGDLAGTGDLVTIGGAAGPGLPFPAGVDAATGGSLVQSASLASGPTLTTLVSFDVTDGGNPQAGLIADAAGNLFGTTYGGAANDNGSIFEIANTSTGYASTPTTLASASTAAGYNPRAGLFADASGDLFGTASFGGANGDGTVYEIAKTDGSYASALTTLVTFNGTNGSGPYAGLIADAAGDLFTTTEGGGALGYGAVIEIPYSDGSYASAPTTLVSFNGTNGGAPYGGLVADAAGNLFGTTDTDGADNEGTVFEIAKTGGSYASAPTVLVNFNGFDGGSPHAGLIVDAAGDLFGTTQGGGANGDGEVFEIAKTGGTYASTPITLVSFNGTDGAYPGAGLIADADGDLFGTTANGGANNLGTVFEIAETAGGYASTPVTLVSFTGLNGANPNGLLADAAGDLFGTTAADGANGGGTVFEVSDTGFQVADRAWSTDAPGNFDDPTRWSDGVVPGAANDAVIDFADDPQVLHDSGSDTLHSLTDTAGDLIMAGGTLATAALTNASAMAWSGGSLILNSGTTASANLANTATATLLNTAGASLAIAPNGQRLTATGTGTASVSNAGTITVDGALGEA